ncbi:hypothetical protein Ae201684P_015755 [Aphanomyces euteiches]|uniref:Uncharacterized protein n=1 Tax=Aphanomyces euteiches TaxID=100861 RepID=A0A6G0WIP3_9STRA|nr:hypothetical protein Ae201684_014816 [Aphanomyces euteiches]KAH9072682.1 hypothetical protein Ae201684P_015755 [Aphanomyces euteiches]
MRRVLIIPRHSIRFAVTATKFVCRCGKLGDSCHVCQLRCNDSLDILQLLAVEESTELDLSKKLALWIKDCASPFRQPSTLYCTTSCTGERGEWHASLNVDKERERSKLHEPKLSSSVVSIQFT